MKSRAALAALERDLEDFRTRAVQANLGAIPLLKYDETEASRRSLEEALALAPDRGTNVARAIIINQSAGTVSHDTEEEEEVATEPVVRPIRRVAWDAVWPLPGVRPGRDDVTGRAWYERLPDGRLIVGQTVDGEGVTVNALGPVIVEPGDG